MKLSTIPVATVYNADRPKELYYRQKEAELLNFIEKNLTGENSEIYTNIKKSEEPGEILSESIGLMMNYCIIRQKKELFDKNFSFLKNELLTENYFIKWRKGKEKTVCNAVIDDLRIIRTLLDAYDIWGDQEYFDMAGFIQQCIYSNQLDELNLCELYDWEKGECRESIPLCYIDFYTLDRLRNFNVSWPVVADRGFAVVNDGRIGETTPFYYKYFNYVTEEYSMDEEYAANKGICLTYTLYTAIHLAEMNRDTAFFTSWLKNEMNKGKLYAWYNPHTLKPVNKMESTAVYALASVYASKTGEDELSRKLLDRMLEFMVTDKKSPYYGGFGNKDTGEFYSFDNLMALWALGLTCQADI